MCPYKDPEKKKKHDKQYYLKNRKKILKRDREYYRKNIEKIHKRQKNYYHNHPERIKAKYLAYHYVDLEKECQLCPDDDKRTKNLERHHPDYSEPLIVVTVCSECHKWIHKRRKTKRWIRTS